MTTPQLTHFPHLSSTNSDEKKQLKAALLGF